MIDRIFNLCWDEDDFGDRCLEYLLVFIHNCCVLDKDLLSELLTHQSDLLYRTHRYIHVSQDEDPEEKGVLKIQEWYFFLLKIALKSPKTFVSVYNSFISKKQL